MGEGDAMEAPDMSEDIPSRGAYRRAYRIEFRRVMALVGAGGGFYNTQPRTSQQAVRPLLTSSPGSRYIRTAGQLAAGAAS